MATIPAVEKESEVRSYSCCQFHLWLSLRDGKCSQICLGKILSGLEQGDNRPTGAHFQVWSFKALQCRSSCF